jgi:hypothetical protein
MMSIAGAADLGKLVTLLPMPTSLVARIGVGSRPPSRRSWLRRYFQRIVAQIGDLVAHLLAPLTVELLTGTRPTVSWFSMRGVSKNRPSRRKRRLA